MQRIQIIDSHTGGEPTRLVVDGFPDLGIGDMAQRLHILATNHDHWRATTVLEPRGNDVIVGALLCEPVNPAHAVGVIFFNNTGYLGMCGHGTIGLIASLAYMNRLQAGTHIIETPVGDVSTTLHEDGSVSVRNIPAYRLHHNISIDVPTYGSVTGDVAWGGNWFFLVTKHTQCVASDNIDALMQFSCAVQTALAKQNIFGTNGALIDHIELFSDDVQLGSRNFVLCPGQAYDRSPCGTGTSAKLACLAADGKLKAGEIWRQGSIIGSQFEGSFEHFGEQIIPTIRGQAYVCAESTLIIDEQDPFAWGIRLK